MKYSMLVKCEKCGYENFPQHRFCGMCAAELALPERPVPRANPEPQAPRPASPPPRARLEREAVDPRSVRYLLEDEPEPSRWGRYVWLILLVGGLAGGGWYWREDLAGLAAKVTSGVAGASTRGQVEKPSAATGEQATPAENPPAAAPAATSPVAADSSQSPQPDQAQPADSAPAAAVAPPDVSAAPPSRPAPASAMSADDLEVEGEKYLYGNGVAENCGLARKNLLAAAQRSNAKAQNVLGTMYATGHCATRDLPTAYRWFGRSLRKDPGNARIEQDLKVLWNQMTPEEQRVALRSER